MGSNYTIVTQYPGLDTLGGTLTQEVTFVGFTTIPHGTYVEVPIEQGGYTASAVGLTAESNANLIETVWSHDWVVGVQWSQQVNASNQLQSVVIVTVASTSGNSTATTTIPMANLPADVYGSQIANLHEELDAVEAL